MNVIWPRILKTAYRKEPISSFVLIVGAVDTVIGGFDNSWTLTTLGLGTVGLAIGLRWWLIQRARVELPESVPQHYLPSRSSRPALPMLAVSKKNSPPNY